MTDKRQFWFQHVERSFSSRIRPSTRTVTFNLWIFIADEAPDEQLAEPKTSITQQDSPVVLYDYQTGQDHKRAIRHPSDRKPPDHEQAAAMAGKTETENPAGKQTGQGHHLRTESVAVPVTLSRQRAAGD